MSDVYKPYMILVLIVKMLCISTDLFRIFFDGILQFSFYKTNQILPQHETYRVRLTKTHISTSVKNLVMCPRFVVLNPWWWWLNDNHMTFWISVKMVSGCVYLFSFLVFCSLFSTLAGVDAGKDGSTQRARASTSVAQDTTLTVNSTAVTPLTSTSNDTVKEKTIMETIKDNKDMLMRAFYVLIGVTAIVVIYFGVRAWR